MADEPSLPVETETLLRVIARRHQAANAAYDQKLNPETTTVAIVFYISVVVFGLGFVGEYGSAADFFMGMAALPAVISGGMLLSRWLARRKALTEMADCYGEAAKLGFSLHHDGKYEPLKRRG